MPLKDNLSFTEEECRSFAYNYMCYKEYSYIKLLNTHTFFENDIVLYIGEHFDDSSKHYGERKMSMLDSSQFDDVPDIIRKRCWYNACKAIYEKYGPIRMGSVKLETLRKDYINIINDLEKEHIKGNRLANSIRIPTEEEYYKALKNTK